MTETMLCSEKNRNKTKSKGRLNIDDLTLDRLIAVDSGWLMEVA